MLSPSACRMGIVQTTRRKIGTSVIPSRAVLGTSQRSLTNAVDLLSSSSPKKQLWVPRRLCNSARISTNRRWKSTAAVYDSDSDGDNNMENHPSKGFSAAQQLRTPENKLSHEEAWMINLGRGNDNEWLTGPREKEWFTGIHPSDCPGKLCHSC